jgi:polyisoprenoid-binding protein YceI
MQFPKCRRKSRRASAVTGGLRARQGDAEITDCIFLALLPKLSIIFRRNLMFAARRSLFLVLLSCSAIAVADLSAMPPGKYGLDANHGYITFSYSHLGFSNPHIGFRVFSVDLELDSENVENSTVNVTIDATSIDSRSETFNGHLNGANFFDTANHPTITFTSTAISATGENTLDITGDLTIKDVTKPVTLAATINQAGNHPMRGHPLLGVSAETIVSRSEWGLSRNVPNVGDEMTIRIDVELPKAR